MVEAAVEDGAVGWMIQKTQRTPSPYIESKLKIKLSTFGLTEKVYEVLRMDVVEKCLDFL
jgi:hypothetical protein